MSELKTKKNEASVEGFLNAVEHDTRREDGFALLKMMREGTGEEPAMWGPSIVGFGSYHYKYETGREGDMPIVGFSPRKRSQTVYIMDGFKGYQEMLARLGKHRTGKSCLYINKLADVDSEVLREIIRQSVEQMRTSGR